jgi:hypothetical protein
MRLSSDNYLHPSTGEIMSESGPVASCPNCNSPSIQALSVASGSALTTSMTEMALGTAAAVKGGAVALRMTCLNCGAQWEPSRRADWRLSSLTELEAKIARDAGISQQELVNRKAANAQWRRDNPFKTSMSWVATWFMIFVVLVGGGGLILFLASLFN